MHLVTLLLQAEHVHQHVERLSSVPDFKSLSDHHLAGGIIMLLGVLYFLERTEEARRYRFVRYLWPLPLLGLATFLMFWSDDDVPWLQWFFQGMWTQTVVEHKFMESAAILAGAIELSTRLGWLKNFLWRHLISGLFLGAGLILLFHHGLHSHIVHLEHRWMATTTIALSLAKMVSDQRWGGRWVGLFAVPTLLLTLGLQFALYVE